ncbi:MAG: saccharopine dehydrogenase C-terminal domain-containing protein [Ignavibacteriaceae bacterium]
MKNILVVGAGRTAASLIDYLLENAGKYNWHITVADQSLELAKSKTSSRPRSTAIQFNVFDENQRADVVSRADIIVSLLPETHHIHLVKDCLRYKVHLLTASYVSSEMSAFDEPARQAGLIFLNEMGLDPGLDHMDTMNVIQKILNKGGKLLSLRSFGGGLITPESDDNPWGYKITWNPMNVVIAGMASARYVKDGKMKIVPYNRLFLDTHIVEVPGIGKYEAYPNRDSVKYRRIYSIPKIPNVFRGSLRKIGFCKAWNALVQIGITDTRYIVPDSRKLTYNEWISYYLTSNNNVSTKKALMNFLGENNSSDIMKKIEWLGLLSNEKIRLQDATPAEILLDLLKRKWEFNKDDRDMVILQTEVEYRKEKELMKMISSYVIKGKDEVRTAMSQSVGLPLGIGAKLVLTDKIKKRGVLIPVHSEIYKPALKELHSLGIKPTEIVTRLKSNFTTSDLSV